MRMQTVFACAFLLERAEQPSLRYSKRRRLKAARPYGCVALSVLCWVGNVHSKGARTQFQVLVAFHCFHLEFASREANAQVRAARHFDDRAEIAIRCVFDGNRGSRAIAL